MQTEEKPTAITYATKRPQRKRWLLPALAAAVIVVAGAVVVSLQSADGNDVADTVPPTTTPFVVDPSESASALIGRTVSVVPGATSRPDTIEFAEDGTFEVVLGGVVIDHGVYETDGDVISFISEPEQASWRSDPVMGAQDPDIAPSCVGIAGQYRVVFEEGTRLRFRVVQDGCPTRISTANRLEMELATG